MNKQYIEKTEVGMSSTVQPYPCPDESAVLPAFYIAINESGKFVDDRIKDYIN